jgi:conjugative transfer signal peptidase TraF
MCSRINSIACCHIVTRSSAEGATSAPLWLCRRRRDLPFTQRLQTDSLAMTRRGTTLVVTAISIAMVAFTSLAMPKPRLIWNASKSVPVGLYAIAPIPEVLVSNLVVAMPPEPLAIFLADGGYLPLGIPLIKPVLALSGQSICRDKLHVSVDGIEVGMALDHDRRGRALPVWQGCRVIKQDEVFLMNRHEPASLDGRYFGPIPMSAIVGRAEPLWIFEK